MLEILSVLAVLSALILVQVVFRPTASQQTRREKVAAWHKSDSFAVLGAFPSAEAVTDYRSLTEDADHSGVTIDWEIARRVQTETPGLTLVAAARHQIGR